jgi:anti-sigma factor RsiW
VTRPDLDIRAEADLHAYVDDCLDPARRAAVEQELAANEKLSGAADRWRQQNDSIRAAFDRLPADHTPTPIRRLNPDKLADRGVEIAPPGRRASTGIAAIVLAVVAGLFFATAPRDQGRDSVGAPPHAVAALVGASFAAYRTYSAASVDPVEPGLSSPRALRDWLRPQLGHDIPVPDLSGIGLTRLGARIVPGVRGPAAFLMYEDAAHARVAIYVEDGALMPVMAPVAEQVGAVGATAFSRGASDFVVIGSVGRARINQIAATLQTGGQTGGRADSAANH